MDPTSDRSDINPRAGRQTISERLHRQVGLINAPDVVTDHMATIDTALLIEAAGIIEAAEAFVSAAAHQVFHGETDGVCIDEERLKVYDEARCHLIETLSGDRTDGKGDITPDPNSVDSRATTRVEGTGPVGPVSPIERLLKFGGFTRRQALPRRERIAEAIYSTMRSNATDFHEIGDERQSIYFAAADAVLDVVTNPDSSVSHLPN